MTNDNSQWQAVLRGRYPISASVAFECLGGWNPILGRLLHRLEAEAAKLPLGDRDGFRILQIKQKMGRLTVHLSPEGTAAMEAAVAEAGEASIVTCEVCSAPGQLSDRNGWSAVRCGAHEAWTRFHPADGTLHPA